MIKNELNTISMDDINDKTIKNYVENYITRNDKENEPFINNAILISSLTSLFITYKKNPVIRTNTSFKDYLYINATQSMLNLINIENEYDNIDPKNIKKQLEKHLINGYSSIYENNKNKDDILFKLHINNNDIYNVKVEDAMYILKDMITTLILYDNSYYDRLEKQIFLEYDKFSKTTHDISYILKKVVEALNTLNEKLDKAKEDGNKVIINYYIESMIKLIDDKTSNITSDIFKGLNPEDKMNFCKIRYIKASLKDEMEFSKKKEQIKFNKFIGNRYIVSKSA